MKGMTADRRVCEGKARESEEEEEEGEEEE